MNPVEKVSDDFVGKLSQSQSEKPMKGPCVPTPCKLSLVNQKNLSTPSSFGALPCSTLVKKVSDDFVGKLSQSQSEKPMKGPCARRRVS